MKKKDNLIYFSFIFYNKRSAYIYFYNKNYMNYNLYNSKIFNKFFFLNKRKLIEFIPKLNHTNFFRFIYDEFYLNLSTLNFKYNFYKNIRNFRYITKNFNRFLLYKF